MTAEAGDGAEDVGMRHFSPGHEVHPEPGDNIHDGQRPQGPYQSIGEPDRLVMPWPRALPEKPRQGLLVARRRLPWTETDLVFRNHRSHLDSARPGGCPAPSLI